MLDVIQFYSEFLDIEPYEDGTQYKSLCPFHNETNPSFIINPEDGCWYCFGCVEGGGPVTFVEKFLGVNKNYAQYVVDFYKEHNKLPIPSKKEVEEYHKALLSEPELLKYWKAHGVKEDILKEFKIGWDYKTKRIIFPIPSSVTEEFYINLRKYRPAGYEKERTSKVINIKSLGENIYYPYKAFKEDPIFIVEGEKDMIVARAHGINAVTGTGGGSIPKDNPKIFTGKTVYIMTDSDEVGDRVALKYRDKIKPYAREIKRIRLPEKDFSDAIVKYPDLDIYDYIVPFKEEEEDLKEVSLSETYKTINKDKPFIVRGLRVIGEHMKDYQVPIKVTLDTGLEIDIPKRKILAFLDATDKSIEREIKSLAGTDEVEITHMEEVSVQRIYFKEDVNVYKEDLSEAEYNNVSGVYISTGNKIKTNRVYDMKLMRTTHPNTQENIFIILDAKECVLDMDVDINALKYFQRNEDIGLLLDEYYSMWEPHLEVTGRKDLFTVMLLTYLSVLEFKWRNSTVKGRLDSIIIGDTRTGKTKMVRNFMNTLRMGEYVSGENAKATGIIGGINNIKDTWTLNWGKIPINDKRLVVIDEASGLSVEDITMLSQMRSEGILSITKIKQETTYARTRLLWITNPRNGERINNHYWKGYEALNKFLPIQEDLARFDLACSAAIEDVDNIFNYSTKEPMTETEIDRWRQLVLFAWNLPKENIIFNKGVPEQIMKRSIYIGEKFNNSPLFLTANGYEKLARVAIALAVLTFNYDGENIRVDKRHVDYAEKFIISLYQKESFGLANKVQIESTKETVSDEDKTQLKRLEALYPNLKILFRDGAIPQSMVSTILGVDYQKANSVVAELYSMGLVTISGSTSEVKPTPAFMSYIRGK